jgi:hypothetical protein
MENQKVESRRLKFENGHWKMENRNWKLENGNWKMETRKPKLTGRALTLQQAAEDPLKPVVLSSAALIVGRRTSAVA